MKRLMENSLVGQTLNADINLHHKIYAHYLPNVLRPSPPTPSPLTPPPPQS